jgi:1-acyl-sn-glycerol-3-phosphate acyltransferase
MTQSLYVEPSAAHLAEIERRLRLGWGPARRVLSAMASLQVTGSLPDGPCLVLANHSTLIDPITLPIAARRSIQWMGSETVVKAPYIGPFQRWIGTVPKKRFHSDIKAVWTLRKWAQLGSAVGLFPEGERSWDGSLRPFLPGLASLIRLLKIPIVTCRIDNNYRQWPRWAKRPRRGRLAITFDPPWTADAGMTEAALIDTIRQRLSVSPESDLPLQGTATAQGLDNLVHQCPDCGHTGAWSTRWALHYGCGHRYAVDSQHRLHPAHGGQRRGLVETVRTVDQAFSERVRDTGGAGLTTAPLTLLDATGEQPHPVASGPMRLYADRVEVGGVSIPIASMLTANVEFQRMFEIRTRETYYKALLPTGSAYRWPVAIEALRVPVGST